MNALIRTCAGVLLTGAAACSGPVPNVSLDGGNSDPHGSDGGVVRGCVRDGECGAGEVCINCDGDGQCTPGCREDKQCGSRHICQLGTVCQSCPCAPGWCVLDPCRDDDSDGYAATLDSTVHCAIPTGDCDDENPAVHPGAAELCTNYTDDNCDGIVDERDPACQCPNAGQQRCGNSFDCGALGSEGCTKGCCQPCYDYSKPDCSFGAGTYCAQQYGINPSDGCSYGWTCDTCSGCPTTVDPVCALNGSSYDNLCLLQRRSTLLHSGACLPGEGIACEGSVPGLDGGCGTSPDLYCRETCGGGVSCGAGVCTKKGVCLVDSDCPAGVAASPDACDAGTAAFACNNGACVSVCR